MRTRAVVPAIVAAVVLALVAGLVLVLAARGSSTPGRHVAVGVDRGTVASVGPGRSLTVGARPVLKRPPSIVLVLMDDFSLDLVDTMRSAAVMRSRGADYAHAFVVDSLCCVSRSSLLTGQYPHQTGVLTNTANTPNPVGPVGGWEAFSAYGNEARSFPVRLQQRGYTTGFVGKFLNQYEIRDGVAPPVPRAGTTGGCCSVRPTRAGDPEHPARRRAAAGRRPTRSPRRGRRDADKDAAYAGTVTGEMALDFVRTHRDDAAPYFLEVAPYAPHSRTSPTPAYAGDPLFPPAFATARPRPPVRRLRAGPLRPARSRPVAGLRRRHI